MTTPLSPPLEIKRLGDFAGRTFDTVESLEAFAEQERVFWNFATNIPQNPNPYFPTARLPSERWSSVVMMIQQLKTDPTQRGGVERELERIWTKYRVPFSETPDAVFLRDLSESLDAQAFCTAMAVLLERTATPPLTLTSMPTLLGLVAALNHRLGITPEAAAHARHGVEALKSELERNHASAVEGHRAALAQFNDYVGSAKNDFGGFLELSNQASSQAVERGNAAHDEGMKRLHDLQNAYEEKLKLEAPTNYWRSKKKAHNHLSFWYGIVALVFSGAAIVGLVIGGDALLGSIKTLPPETHIAVYLAFAAKGLVVSVFVFWVARILARRYLSELHLGMDAHERMTLIMTYLALTKRGRISEQERPLVLQPIFRPASDGIVKDDGSSDPMLAALVARMIPPKI